VKIVSRKQQRFLGAVASGRIRSKGLSAHKARLMLEENRGIKLSRLPVRKTSRRPASRRLGR
jgi:hypothetical protein